MKYRQHHKTKKKNSAILKIPEGTTAGKRLDAIKKIEETVEKEDLIIKEFLLGFFKEEAVNIIAIDRASTRFYQRGLLHMLGAILFFFFVFKIISALR